MSETVHISQIDLIGAITKHIERKHGQVRCTIRQMNAIIQAATGIVEAFETPETRATPGMGLAAWLRSDDTGRSSELMAATLSPIAQGRPRPCIFADPDDHPHDPDDLGRCIRLLEAVPELRPHVPHMAEVSPVWAALVGRWDELEVLYREEAPSGKAPRCYALMRSLIESATKEKP